jgi:hypothetical protein
MTIELHDHGLDARTGVEIRVADTSRGREFPRLLPGLIEKWPRIQ